MKLREYLKKALVAAAAAVAVMCVVPVAAPAVAPIVAEAANIGGTYTVKVANGYLALRNAKAYSSYNEIGKLYNGETVTLQDASDSTYWYVYSTKLGINGYVNKDYLVEQQSGSMTRTVKVSDGYLALRNAKAYDRNNEIGKLYTGDTVTVQDTSDSTYWYVYSSKLNQYGYVNKNYLIDTNTSGSAYTVKVNDGYLALRNAKAFDYNNEIGKLWSGDTVNVQDTSDSTYWYVYAPGLGKSGYVNKNYLVGSTPAPAPVPTGETMTVRVNDGYLALRNAKAFDYNNEIGKLYTGETVTVTDKSDNAYWYVYAPSLGKSGYVNKDYLVNPNQPTVMTRTVYVNDGYLALRNAKAFDNNNEIGRLYNGATVEVKDTSDSAYWYVYAPSLGKSGYVNKDYLY